jgi:hypothetical protein
VKQFDGVLERIVVFAFDYDSKVAIRASFPSVHVILFTFPQLVSNIFDNEFEDFKEDRFSAGDGRYQLFQYFRASFC